jgi:hypothetical protein
MERAAPPGRDAGARARIIPRRNVRARRDNCFTAISQGEHNVSQKTSHAIDVTRLQPDRGRIAGDIRITDGLRIDGQVGQRVVGRRAGCSC